MTNVMAFGGVPRGRRELARWLRDLADTIESDRAETEPSAALVVLTGDARHEVLWTGHEHQPGFLRGAICAAYAVVTPTYDTAGSNVRPRTHGYAGHKREATVMEISKRENNGSS